MKMRTTSRRSSRRPSSAMQREKRDKISYCFANACPVIFLQLKTPRGQAKKITATERQITILPDHLGKRVSRIAPVSFCLTMAQMVLDRFKMKIQCPAGLCLIRFYADRRGRRMYSLITHQIQRLGRRKDLFHRHGVPLLQTTLP